MPQPSAAKRKLSAGKLSTAGIAALAMCAVTPMTVAIGIIPSAYDATGITALPLAFALVPAILGLFSVGFLAMARHIRNPGAFYAFIATGLNPSAGIAAAWVALISYCALQIGLYGAIGPALAPILDRNGIHDLHWAIPALIMLAVVTIMGTQKVTLSTWVLKVVLIVDTSWIVITTLVLLAHPAPGTTLASTASTVFSVDSLPAALVGMLIAVLGCVGFEITAVYGPRARDERTAPRATRVVLAALGVVYVLVALGLLVAVGPNAIQTEAHTQGPQLVFNLARTHFGVFGEAWVQLGEVLFALGVFAAGLSFLTTFGQYAFSLGREGALPASWGFDQVSPRTEAPVRAILVQSTLALLCIVIAGANGWDPMMDLFFRFGAVGALGVLILLVGVSAAALVFLNRHRDEYRWSTRVGFPAASGLAIVGLLILAVANFDVVLNNPQSALRWGAPIAFVVVIVLGLAHAARLKTKNPDNYARLGQGFDASIATTTRAGEDR